MHTLTVADIMSTELVTIDAAMSLLGVAAVLSERHLSGAPVLDANRVAGVISAADVLRHAASVAPATAVAGESEPELAEALREWTEEEGEGDGDDSAAEFYTRLELAAEEELEVPPDHRPALEQTTAGDIMTRTLCSLPPDASVIEAANYMSWAEIHRLLVVEHGELVGIVTAMDIVRAVAQRKM